MTAACRRMAPRQSSHCKLLIIVLHANREHRRDAYASMRPTLSRPAAKIVFFLFFFILTPSSGNTSPPLALVLGRCGARYERRNDQTPKPVTLRARNVVGSRRATE